MFFDKFILYSKKSKNIATSKYNPIFPKFCIETHVFMCNKGSLVEQCISNF